MGYCLVGQHSVCLPTNWRWWLEVELFGTDARILFSPTTTKTNRVHEPPTSVGGCAVTSGQA